MAFLVWHRWGPGLEAASLYFFNNLAAAMGVLKGLYYWNHVNIFARLSTNFKSNHYWRNVYDQESFIFIVDGLWPVIHHLYGR